MSDGDAKPGAANGLPTAGVKSAKGGAAAAICDALKELFEHAPKRALGWVCAGVAVFAVLIGVGMMGALILYGWPSMSAEERVKNWELKAEAGKPVVEVRNMDKEGLVTMKKVDVPKGVSDPKSWAIERFGEQRPLSMNDEPAASAESDTSVER